MAQSANDPRAKKPKDGVAAGVAAFKIANAERTQRTARQVRMQKKTMNVDRSQRTSIANVKMQECAMIAKAANFVREKLPQHGPRVLVLGGRTFESPETFALVKAVSAHFAKELAGRAVVLTGGAPGVQKAFAKGLGGSFPGLCHLLPEGRTSSQYGVGRDVQCGVDLEHRPAVAARLADVVLVFAGGATVAREATAAFARGAIVISMRCAGGSSSAAFNLPDAAFECPVHVAMRSEWDLLTGQPCKVEAVAVAVASIVARVAGRLAAPGRTYS